MRSLARRGLLASVFPPSSRPVVAAAAPRVHQQYSSGSPSKSGDAFVDALAPSRHPLDPLDTFVRRHIGSPEADLQAMLKEVGASSLADLMHQTVPQGIRRSAMQFGDAPVAQGGGAKVARDSGEVEALEQFRAMMARNQVKRSYLGLGYFDSHLPLVLLRNVLENPAFYTPYTPYQAEISQGRLEMLFCFQTMVCELTGLDVANASLLDEATAAAEAMNMAYGSSRARKAKVFYVSDRVNPQTIAVIRTRADALLSDIRVVVCPQDKFDLNHPEGVFGALLQYPAADGAIDDPSAIVAKLHEIGALAVAAVDPLALCMVKEPGAIGFDVAVGTTQRFGVPMGYGGPHAGFMAVRDKFKRIMPGRLIGLSRDAAGRPSYRMSLQTREQHIRREKATSNICTAQALLANISTLYAMYHGPQGLRDIAASVHGKAALLAEALRLAAAVPGARLRLEVRSAGASGASAPFFDTLRIVDPNGSGRGGEALRREVLQVADANVRVYDADSITVSMDETVTADELRALARALGVGDAEWTKAVDAVGSNPAAYNRLSGTALGRTTPFLRSEQFNLYHTEHEMLRYLTRLHSRDIGLHTSMIPARLVHDEAQRRGRDVSRLVARVREDSSVRAHQADARLPEAV
jgi:glycine dehydrogenase